MSDLSYTDSSSINFSGDGSAATPLTGAVIVDPAAGNALAVNAGGLFVPDGASNTETTYAFPAAPDATGDVDIVSTDETGTNATQTVNFAGLPFVNLVLNSLLDGVAASDAASVATLQRLCDAMPTTMTEV